MQKKVLATAIAAAMCAPIVAEAVTVKFSGHVNRMIRWADDGVGSDIAQAGHGGSRTRLRWAGSQDMGNGVKAGVYTEIAAARNVSPAIKAADSTGDNFGLRHASVNFSGAFGRIDAGFTTNANAGTYLDLSGTSAYDPAGNNLVMNTAIRTSVDDGAGRDSGVTTGTAFNSFTYGRDNLIKYSSPKIGPLTVAASMGHNEAYAWQVNLNTSMGGSRLQARVGYRDEDNNSNNTNFNISGGMAFSQGTSISLNYNNRDFVGGLDSEYWYAKLGHKFGNNTVALGYYSADDMGVAGDDSEEWSVTFVHNIPKPRVHLYATYSNFDYSHPTIATEDVDQFLVGSRIFF